MQCCRRESRPKRSLATAAHAPVSIRRSKSILAHRRAQAVGRSERPQSQSGMSTAWAVAAVIAALCLGCYAFFLKLKHSLTGNLGLRLTQPASGAPGGKILLNGFFTPVGNLASSASPFTAKIETFLRMKGLPYTEKVSDFATSPNGRVSHLQTCKPFIGQ